MKILVVAHNAPGGGPYNYYDFPLGIAYISSALKNAGFDVDCLNLNHFDDYVATFAATLTSTRPDVVCFGGLSPQFGVVDQVNKLVREHAPQALTVIGGGLITAEPEIVFDLLNPDFAVVGEGDDTICELVRALEQGSDVGVIAGLVYRDPETHQVLTTARRPEIADLDRIPFPDFEGLDAEHYVALQETNDVYYFHTLDSKPRMLPLISSRGCPYACSFCFHPTGRRYRMRSVSNFFEELEQVVERYRLNYVCVYDELLSSNAERVYEFCRRMETYGIGWSTQLRVDQVDPELLAELRRSGCTVIGYGIESASNHVLDSMGKHTTVEQVDRALEMTRKCGIGVQGNIIFGDLAETEESVDASIAWYREHEEYLLGMGMIECYPGSPIYKYAKRENLIPDLEHFLREGGRPINATSMTELQYRRTWLRSRYEGLRAALNQRVETPDARMTGLDPRGDSLYEFSTRCPHCGATTKYSDFNVRSTTSGQRVLAICGTCLQRMSVIFGRQPYRWELFVYGTLLALPTRIGTPVLAFYERVRSLSHFTFSQNLDRIRRFVAARLGKSRRRPVKNMEG